MVASMQVSGLNRHEDEARSQVAADQGGSKPPLLFLTQRIPYPPIKGEKIRPFHLLRYLAETFELHVGCLIDNPDDWQHVGKIEAMARTTYFARLPRRRRYTCLKGLLTGDPLSFSFFRDAGLARWVDATLSQVRPLVTFVCSTNMTPYVLDRETQSATLLVDYADVDSEKWRAYAERTRGPMRWIYRREAERVFRAEKRIAEAADAASFVTDAEAALFAELVPSAAAKTCGISNGVDSGYFSPDAAFEPRCDIGVPTYVFTGTMDYWPNVDAVTWFAKDMLPRIRLSCRDARFLIVGAQPSGEVQSLAACPGVEVTGRVDDVRPYLAAATAAVAPLRVARGIQNKVLEAMAMAKPVIATPEAIEGIDLEPGVEAIVVSGAAAIASAAIAAARGEISPDIGILARRRVVSQYNWRARLAGFDPHLAAVLNKTAPRNAPPAAGYPPA